MPTSEKDYTALYLSLLEAGVAETDLDFIAGNALVASRLAPDISRLCDELRAALAEIFPAIGISPAYEHLSPNAAILAAARFLHRTRRKVNANRIAAELGKSRQTVSKQIKNDPSLQKQLEQYFPSSQS